MCGAILNAQTNFHFNMIASHLTPANGPMDRLVAGLTQRYGALPGSLGAGHVAYVDTSFRRLFYTDTDVLSEYQLESSERDAVCKIDKRSLEFFAVSLMRKRRERIERAYPALFCLDGQVLERYYKRYYQIFTAHSGADLRSDADSFGRCLWESIVEEVALPPYTRDLVRYEHLDFLT